MAQLCEFVVNAEKPKDWHLYFLRELLGHVNEEKPTERRYMKWLRERKVFDRKLLAFLERLCGIDRAPMQAPQLGEVARDLLDAIEKAKKKAEDDAAKAVAAQKKGRETTSFRPSSPDDELDEEKAFADKAPEPVAADDLFVKAVLERAVELNSYLAKFAFREVGDDFLAVTELYRRMSTSAYAGKRPSLPQFEAWVKWQEWLGGLLKVGFRHKATPAGKEHGKALKDVPDSELLVPSREDDLVIEAPASAPAAEAPASAAGGGALVANAPTGRRSLEVTEDEDSNDEDDDAAREEGLELPPATTPPPAPDGGFWANKKHDDAATPRGPMPDPLIAPKPFSDVMKEITEATASIAPAPIAPSERSESRGPAQAFSPGTTSPLLSWWHAAGRPGERLGARDAGLDLAIYRGPQRGVIVFKLLALASFVESQPRAHGVAFFRELAGRSAFEALFHEEAPLDRVVDLDPARPLLYGASLVALLRFRRALKKDGLLARLDGAADGRELARTLRSEVTGDALSTGVLLVVREMAQAGHWRARGVDSLGCVPFAEAREAAWRLGLIASASAATFDELIAASEALSAHLGAADEFEVPLRAYAAWTLADRGALP